MWKIFNKLFGWEYVAWRNTAASGVARVHTEKYAAKPYYWRYKNICVIDRIENADQVTWLTCHPSKYGL